MNVKEAREKLRALSDRERAEAARRYFKTGPGEYGEGDVFLGIRVPDLRRLARECKGWRLKETETLMRSRVHEERLLALFILVGKYGRGEERERRKICDLYLRNTKFVNNWDLVDSSAAHIVGAFLMDRGKETLYELAGSSLLWERRIAIVSTFHFIKRGRFSETLEISELLLSDPEDLIHKAVGWMLREIGKRDLETEENFLKRHYKTMPRTMLRYAIERFPETRRKRYLEGTI